MTGPWIAAFGALVVMVVALTILVLGVLATVDRALDEITSRPPSNVRALGGLEVGQAARCWSSPRRAGANPCS
jgi:hypothetical protein